MSETAERTAKPPGQPTGGAPPGKAFLGALRRGGGAFLRQREATVLVIVIVLFVYFTLTNPSFLGTSNLTNLLSGYASQYIILGIGEVLLLICGEIDLSVGFIFLFAPFLMYYLITDYGVPAILALLLALLFGVAVGWLNGFLTVTMRLPSFITTLGTGFLLWGATDITSHAEPVNIPASIAGTGKYFGSQTGAFAWSAIIWAVVLVAIFHVVLTRTRWGLHTIAVGGNLLGATEAGISVTRIKYGNFMITGFMGALVGLQVAFYTNTIDPSSGQYTPMFYAVTAAIIGGTAMLGGVGTILGGFLGALVVAILQDGFQIIGVNANALYFIFGLAILIAMIANVQLARFRGVGRNR